jgi:hypothetical protein
MVSKPGQHHKSIEAAGKPWHLFGQETLASSSRLPKQPREPPVKLFVHLNAGLGGRAQPVAVGGEAQSVNYVAGIQTVQALALSQVPQHCHPILHDRTSTLRMSQGHALITIIPDAASYTTPLMLSLDDLARSCKTLEHFGQ